MTAPRARFGAPGPARPLAEEVAVALTFNGTTQAVMMATPRDLEDFARGFALTEGIARPGEIEGVEVVATPRGIDVQTWIAAVPAARLARRRRTMAGPVGCGLCGIDSLEEALRDVVPVPPSALRITPGQVMGAVAALTAHQPLHDATRAVHAAAWWTPAGGIALAREDVGRHNALDKLAGALVARPQPPGAVVLTSRVSIDLVQKAAVLGAPVVIAVSAPTDAAVRLAAAAGITLIALARPDRFDAFTHIDRITENAVVA